MPKKLFLIYIVRIRYPRRKKRTVWTVYDRKSVLHLPISEHETCASAGAVQICGIIWNAQYFSVYIIPFEH